jgi:pimeloyl-ACP methyl ester carboxylesterase
VVEQFVWGREDRLVPIGFARHVREALPRAEHFELDCGHVPQLERPRETHAAILRFLGASGVVAGPRDAAA